MPAAWPMARRCRRSMAAAARAISTTMIAASRTSPTSGAALREYLGEQLRLSLRRSGGPHDRRAPDRPALPGRRLTAEPAAIADAMAIPLERVEAVRARMMRFDPVGLFARDLKECLAAQLAERNRLDPAMQALLDNLELLARRELRRLMAVCGVDAEDLADMIAEIRSLDPKPGASYDDDAGAARGARHPDAARRRTAAG